MTTDTVHPEVLWAQRTDLLYIRINVSDLTNDELKVTEEGLTFKGESSESQKRYEANLTFFKPVNPDMVRRDKTGRALRLVIPKKTDEAYWPRLLKDKARLPFLKVDFEMWRDEDEEKEEEENLMSSMAAGAGGAGGLDFSQLAGMNGMDFSKFDPSAFKGAGAGDSDDEEEKIEPEVEVPEE